MEYSHDDAELIRQPIGYWSWAAYDAIVSRTRGALAELGTTQPQWWILARVALAGDEVRTRDGLTETLRGYLAVGEEALSEEMDTVIVQGWITQDAAGRLEMTPEGQEFFDKAAALQKDLWDERHAGISDEEYLITLKVLQRFIHNVGGRAWHH
ncbi:MarR family winged helix-turn-helix transcriptional regulator [Streptomyces xanthophaeus]|uniref:MarR family winged helix-turn-helix transcriptional regulator n=1 Tax=Streptomyces xanthophaeus TaxID=67385 RepID=UPI0026492554|nr:MarR family winged helix-turn-helix transcriptional regulator [Streptomyces xanthophaeus]WKD31635.1 MarR family winged helix-turn-helix transcriptional regulator [Streptomyces xanthophaeus]